MSSPRLEMALTGPGRSCASHEDRDRVEEILRVAAGDGRLTAAELDERLEAARTSRTNSERAVLTADLPAVAGQPGGVVPQAKDMVRIDCHGSTAQRAGAGWSRGGWRSLLSAAR